MLNYVLVYIYYTLYTIYYIFLVIEEMKYICYDSQYKLNKHMLAMCGCCWTTCIKGDYLLNVFLWVNLQVCWHVNSCIIKLYWISFIASVIIFFYFQSFKLCNKSRLYIYILYNVGYYNIVNWIISYFII